ncbi:hypothetical protein GNF82_22540, partial [Clostridium perfringens]
MASESNKNAVQAETTQQEKQKRTLQRLDRQTQQLVATRRTLANTPANHSSAPSPSSANHSYNQGGVIQDKGPSLIRRMESWN